MTAGFAFAGVLYTEGPPFSLSLLRTVSAIECISLSVTNCPTAAPAATTAGCAVALKANRFLAHLSLFYQLAYLALIFEKERKLFFPFSGGGLTSVG